MALTMEKAETLRDALFRQLYGKDRFSSAGLGLNRQFNDRSKVKVIVGVSGRLPLAEKLSLKTTTAATLQRRIAHHDLKIETHLGRPRPLKARIF